MSAEWDPPHAIVWRRAARSLFDHDHPPGRRQRDPPDTDHIRPAGTEASLAPDARYHPLHGLHAGEGNRRDTG